MSDYWDAVGHAALGRSGTATPRPRSIFEPDVTTAPIDDIEATAEVLATEPSPPATVASVATPRVARPDIPPDTRILDAEPARVRDAEAEATPVERSRDESRRDEPAEPTPSASPRLSTDARTTATVVERVEVNRTESTKVVLQAQAPSSTPPTDEPPRTAAGPIALRELGEPAATGNEIEERHEADVAAPIAVAAEPRIVVTEPVGAAPEGTEPALVIEIDRIEIRIESEHVAPVVAPRRRAAQAAPSLSDYLARYGEQTR